MRRCDVVRICAHSPANYLGINSGAARKCVLEFFKNNSAAAFTKHKPVTLLVIGTRGSCGIIVARAHCLAGIEPAHAALVDRRLAATCNKGRGLAKANVVEGVDESVGG